MQNNHPLCGKERPNMKANPAVRLVHPEPENKRSPESRHERESELALYQRRIRETVSVLSESLTRAFWGDFSVQVRSPADTPEELKSFGMLINGIINMGKNSLSREARLNNEYIQALVRVTGEGIFRIDTMDRILLANPAAEAILGWKSEEMFGKQFCDIFRGTVRGSPLVTMIRDSWHTYTSDSDFFLGKGGKEIPVSITASSLIIDGKFLGINVVFRNLSEQRKLEGQLFQAQKLESIGRLVGGIAHDFNNILTVINGYSEYGLSKDKDCESAGHKDCFEQIFSAGKKAAALTQHLLAYSRQQIVDPVQIDLNKQLRDMEKLLRRILGETTIQTHFSKDRCHIKMDPVQLEQVILNIAVNAKDAMPKTGALIIETEPATLDAAYASRYPDVKPGPYVLLTISDTGTGMAKEVLKHIFEPYFTTKEKGKGTGLGLATCYGIIKQAEGQISVYSEVGHGTTFKIYLPRMEAGQSVEEETSPKRKDPGICATKTILVVEDDSMVRRLVVTCLKSCGYTLLVAHSSEEAIRVMTADNPPKADLLLTDVVMPKMNGKELADALKTVAPEMRVVFMSGYTKNAIVHNGSLAHGVAFIQKPFSVDNLLSVVEKALKNA